VINNLNFLKYFSIDKKEHFDIVTFYNQYLIIQ